MLLLRKPCQARNQSPEFLHALPISDENKASSNGDSNADYFFSFLRSRLGRIRKLRNISKPKKKRNNATSQSLYDIEALTATRAPNVGSLLFFHRETQKSLFIYRFLLRDDFFLRIRGESFKAC